MNMLTKFSLKMVPRKNLIFGRGFLSSAQGWQVRYKQGKLFAFTSRYLKNAAILTMLFLWVSKCLRAVHCKKIVFWEPKCRAISALSMAHLTVIFLQLPVWWKMVCQIWMPRDKRWRLASFNICSFSNTQRKIKLKEVSGSLNWRKTYFLFWIVTSYTCSLP